MISQTLEYALRAVVYLAKYSPDPCTTQKIAEVTMVPPAYLSKVLQGLRRNGIVYSQRGAAGGMSLVKKADEVTILEVVNAVDPIKRIHTCPLGLENHCDKLCSLHSRLDTILAQAEEAFSKTTLAELLVDPQASVPLCNLPTDPILVDIAKPIA